MKQHSDFFYIDGLECKLREVLKKQKLNVCVGDFAEYEKIGQSQAVITKILPRKNEIKRPNVSNVDQIVIVSSIKEPDLDFIQLNRYICLAKYYKIPAVLCFNKNDLSLDDTVIEKVFQIYEPLGYEILFISALEKVGLEDLIEILKGKTSVLAGTSGVGKTTIINSLIPDSNLKTKQVSEKTKRGTHTTRHCSILKFKNIKIVDTPGFSRLTFDFLMPNELDELFEEIKIHKKNCKFKNCTHTDEPGCAVLENIDKINLSRYESYINFLSESKKFKEKIKLQGRKTETFSKKNSTKSGLKSSLKVSVKKRKKARNNEKQEIKSAR